MALSIGIVGLPNVGKSTVFNALTQAQNAEVANYPSARSSPTAPSYPCPTRLERLAEMVPTIALPTSRWNSSTSPGWWRGQPR